MKLDIHRHSLFEWREKIARALNSRRRRTDRTGMQKALGRH
jgi:hypothetical protein